MTAPMRRAAEPASTLLLGASDIRRLVTMEEVISLPRRESPCQAEPC
jgi:hypothetical protein